MSPEGHRLMTAGQAPCRRSPCPCPAPRGTSIPPDPSPPIPREAPSPRARRRDLPIHTHTHAERSSSIPGLESHCLLPSCPGISPPPHWLTNPANTHSPRPDAHCLPPPPAPRNPVILLASTVCPHGPGTFSPAVPAGTAALVVGRTGGRAPCLGAALLCPISTAG